MNSWRTGRDRIWARVVRMPRRNAPDLGSARFAPRFVASLSVRERRRVEVELGEAGAVRAVGAAGLAVAALGARATGSGRGGRPRRRGRRRGCAGGGGRPRRGRRARRRARPSDAAASTNVCRASSRSPAAQSAYGSSAQKSPRYRAVAWASSASAFASSPVGQQPAALGRLAQEQLDVDVDVLAHEPHRVVVGGDVVVRRPRLPRVEHAADRAQQHRQPARRAVRLVGPQQRRRLVADDRRAAPGDEQLEQVAGLARPPVADLDRRRRPGSPGTRRAW